MSIIKTYYINNNKFVLSRDGKNFRLRVIDYSPSNNSIIEFPKKCSTPIAIRIADEYISLRKIRFMKYSEARIGVIVSHFENRFYSVHSINDDNTELIIFFGTDEYECGEFILFEKEYIGNFKSYIGNTSVQKASKILKLDNLYRKRIKEILEELNLTYGTFILLNIYPELVLEFTSKQVEELVTFYDNIDLYVETINLKGILDKYELIIETGGRSKPGGDDTAWAYKKSRHSDLYDKHDFYLSELLPTQSIRLFYEFGYTSYNTLLNEFNTEFHEKQAKEETENRIKHALLNYSVELHKDELKKRISEKISEIEKSAIAKAKESLAKILRC